MREHFGSLVGASKDLLAAAGWTPAFAITFSEY
jgi:hypothetical protein